MLIAFLEFHKIDNALIVICIRENSIFGKVFCPSALSVGTDIVSEHRVESVFGQVNPALIFFSVFRLVKLDFQRQNE